MKNQLIIDIDSDRDQQIQIGKPPEFKQPETPEEIAKMLVNDIDSVLRCLLALIEIAGQNGVDSKELTKQSIKILEGTPNE